MKRIQVMSFLASLGLLGIVLELVRRKMIKEKFALLWVISVVFLLIFSLWGNLLELLAKILGIYYPPSVLLPIMIFFGVVLFLYFSVIVTKQDEKIKNLTQQISILEERLREIEEKEQNE